MRPSAVIGPGFTRAARVTRPGPGQADNAQAQVVPFGKLIQVEDSIRAFHKRHETHRPFFFRCVLPLRHMSVQILFIEDQAEMIGLGIRPIDDKGAVGQDTAYALRDKSYNIAFPNPLLWSAPAQRTRSRTPSPPGRVDNRASRSGCRRFFQAASVPFSFSRVSAAERV